jgi:hypothetical protein
MLCSGGLDLKRKCLRIFITIQNKVIVGPDKSFGACLRSIGTRVYLFNLHLFRNSSSSSYYSVPSDSSPTLMK